MGGAAEWEVARSASGTGGARSCLLDAAILTQWEHRGRQCTRVVISSSIDRAQVQYTCVGAGFGTSNVQVLTPRSIKVDTQGIAADGLPFSYVIHARRVGACQAR
jgi:hypothetical protein